MVLPVVIVGIILGWETGSTQEGTPSPPPPTSERTVTIVPGAAVLCEKGFDPPVVTIKVGMTVVWVNEDRETHTLVSSDGSDPCRPTDLPPEDRVIDGGQLPYLKRYRQTFLEPGEYPYTCHLPFHQMTGKIIVVP